MNLKISLKSYSWLVIIKCRKLVIYMKDLMVYLVIYFFEFKEVKSFFKKENVIEKY